MNDDNIHNCNGYTDEMIITDNKIQRVCDDYPIMRVWEEPLMKRHAEIVCRNGGNILEIGFGMGLSATAIQEQPNVTSHTIVEPQDQIIEELLIPFKNKHKNVTVLEDTWLEHFKLGTILHRKYDGIFYDAEFDRHVHMLGKVIKYFLKPGGIFSFFNSIPAKVNIWGLDCEYEEFKIEDMPEYSDDDMDSNPYMNSDINYIPIYTQQEAV